MIMFLVFVSFALTLYLAHKKYRNPVVWGLLGAFLPFISLVVIFCLPKIDGISRKWPVPEGVCKYTYLAGDSAIGLDVTAEVIHLMSDNKYKNYPFGDIRKWRTSLVDPGAIYGGGVNAIGAQMRNNTMAKKDSGFFVTVKDIDNPNWKVEIFDEKEQARWMEIFEQYVNKA